MRPAGISMTRNLRLCLLAPLSLAPHAGAVLHHRFRFALSNDTSKTEDALVTDPVTLGVLLI